eukprot:TRINITY_DN2175_c0_g1_i1.p2 TRINITY_DN2175_c0_g1~~TRINITY_DN2175_c0_g1_i1.p2  ORF type:complete len:219 (-),score=39.53 TRINITY_DN2175_c0_g1_i1:398-1015(-)
MGQEDYKKTDSASAPLVGGVPPYSPTGARGYDDDASLAKGQSTQPSYPQQQQQQQYPQQQQQQQPGYAGQPSQYGAPQQYHDQGQGQGQGQARGQQVQYEYAQSPPQHHQHYQHNQHHQGGVTTVVTVAPVYNVAVAWLLWLTCFWGCFGLHRCYTGRWCSGIIWFFTAGLCLVGQVLDMCCIYSMVDDANQRTQYGIVSHIQHV